MTTINRLLAMLVLLALAAWCQSPRDNKVVAIDALAAKYVNAGQSPGLAVGVVRAGKIVLAKGYGLANLEQSTPVTPTLVFRANSMTNQFTAAGIMLLAERGKLRIDGSLADFFPDFPRAAEITIRQLLTHTSGLSTYDTKPDFRTFSVEPHSVPQIIQWIRSDAFVADPGAAWNYSNSGFLLLAGIIEKASGQRYSTFMQKNIFDKLRLTQTSIEDETKTTTLSDGATGYVKAEGAPGFTPVGQRGGGNGGGGASGLSTVNDLLRWHDALFHGQLLTPASFAEMTKPARLKNGEAAVANRIMPGAHYGFGLFLSDLNGHSKIGHTGTGGGFHSIIMTYPSDQVTIVLLSNVNGQPSPSVPQLEKAIAGIMLDVH